MVPLDVDPKVGPRAKIDRAKEHLNNFKFEIDAFIASNPYVFRQRRGSDGLSHVVLDKQKPIPVRWSTIVGDIVHNSRSALDLLVSCSVLIETDSFRRLKFPIFSKRSEFEDKALRDFGENCPRTVRFLRLLKPYDRRNDPVLPNRDLGHHGNTLAILNRLSVRDKHRLIIPVGVVAGQALVRPDPGFGMPFELSPPSLSLLRNGEIIISFDPNDPLFAGKKFKTDITTKICLGGHKEMPFIGAHGLLAHIVKVVDRIVGIAERHLYIPRTTRGL